jgi:glycine cleavage system T protein
MSRPDVYANQILESQLGALDPFVSELIRMEEVRQRRKIILIPSESICPGPVREALASPFTNIYAEGYPPRLMEGASEEEIGDLEWQLINYRRYADRRFYKGCEYVHEVESLAKQRAAECFANAGCPSEAIHVNVQPLSGSAANNAVYEAFLKPGDMIMGMALPAGGHLTHGSEFNRSGKRYTAVSYGVNPESERLDYDEIRRLACEHRPRLIVAGFTSYPWAPDWPLFRDIADEVGAILLADIAHPAGLVVAGLHPNPVGIADVITFTTHKTLCGPRGAVIMTTDPAMAEMIDLAVFPGEQGGPHVNKMVAMAVAFNIAKTEAFMNLQKRIVENASALAQALVSRGVKLCYGGTNSHLLVVDLRNMGQQTGYPMMGEIAARVLDLAGIVVNKNTIPGDESAADARGIRMGSPWTSQRGMGPKEMETIAHIIHRLLGQIHPFTYQGVASVLPRGKLPIEALEEARQEVQALLAGLDKDLGTWQYPHDHGLYPTRKPRTSHIGTRKRGRTTAASRGKILVEDHTDKGVLEVRGERAWAFLQEVCTQDLVGLAPGEGREALILDRNGRYMDEAVVICLAQEVFIVLTHPSRTQEVCSWFRRLSEGYVLFDIEDVLIKVQGPVRVWDRNNTEIPEGERKVALAVGGPGAEVLWEGESNVLTIKMPGENQWILLTKPESALQLWEGWRRDSRVVCVDSKERDERRKLEGWVGEKDREMSNAIALWRARSPLFDLNKPYFVGLSALREVWPTSRAKKFFPPAPSETLRRSCLYEEHVKRAKKIASFAGWEMPIWYQSIQDEHQAVRFRAGLFDISHMGVIGIEGEDGAHFLDIVTSNYVRWLRVGESQYSYMLDPEGRVIDDLMVYRIEPRKYLLVVNAVNTAEDLAWLNAVSKGEVSLDALRPGVRFRGRVQIKDLKDPVSGEEALVDVAIQGPASLETLLRLAAHREDAWRLRSLKKAEVKRVVLKDIPIFASRTGYTGEPVGFEIFVHPDLAPKLWWTILEAGEDMGVVPVGLGARDSLRTEAGLPLHGHELAGPHQIDPMMAGFEGYVKLHKPFFVGRKTMAERMRAVQRKIIRFRLLQKGVRMLHPGDLVIHRRTNQVMGWVSSAAINGDGMQVGMGLIEARFARPGTPIALLSRGHGAISETGEIEPGGRWPLHEEGVVLSRFLEKE